MPLERRGTTLIATAPGTKLTLRKGPFVADLQTRKLDQIIELLQSRTLPEKLLSKSQAASFIGVSEDTFDTLLRDPVRPVPHMRCGRQYRFNPVALMEHFTVEQTSIAEQAASALDERLDNRPQKKRAKKKTKRKAAR